MRAFTHFGMDYFTIDKTGEKDYRDIYYAYSDWSSRDKFVEFFTRPLKKPALIKLRKKMLPKVKSIGAWMGELHILNTLFELGTSRWGKGSE